MINYFLFERTPAKMKDIGVPGNERNYFLHKNQNWATHSHLNRYNLQKKEKIVQNSGIFPIFRAIAHLLLYRTDPRL